MFQANVWHERRVACPEKLNQITCRVWLENGTRPSSHRRMKASGEARIVTARQNYLFGNREKDAVISEQIQFLKDDDSDLPTLNIHVD
jgi:hypothetical protein